MGEWPVAASELAKLFAKHFINRPDVKAVQNSDGSYMPVREGPRDAQVNVSWKAADIEAHIAGQATYGHYLLNTDDTVKLFCFDVDLRHTRKQDGSELPDGYAPQGPFDISEPVNMYEPVNPRAVWADRRDARRAYLKYCMRQVAHILGERIGSELEIPWCVAYSGSKGIHVYGLTGRVSAKDAREGALIVIDSIGIFELERGDSLFKYGGNQASDPFINFSIEVYPKQESLAGKDLGNLLRLPLGRNTKSKDPTFFMDMTAPLTEMRPVDPVYALTGNPWKRPGE
jgi:hypothetical protein